MLGNESRNGKIIKIDPPGDWATNNIISVKDDENNEIHKIYATYPFITKKLPDFYKKYHLNFAVKSFTIERFSKIISEFMLDNSNSINISVGSGNGFVERYLKNNFKIEIICIEPHFDKIILNQFKKKFDELSVDIKNNLEPPKFDKAENYDGKTENINLFINWESPANYEEDYIEGKGYGIESIKILKPQSLIIVHGLAAGGDMLNLTHYETGIMIINDKLKYKLKTRISEDDFRQGLSPYETHVHIDHYVKI